MANKKFIITKDKNTANRFKENGFSLVSEFNGQWTFLNEGKSIVSFNKQNVVYTNSLFI